MNDLFNKFQESKKSNGQKSKYGVVECLAIMLMIIAGKDNKQIKEKIGRSENGLTYVLSSRVLGNVKNYKGLCEKLKVDYNVDNEKRDLEQAKKLIG